MKKAIYEKTILFAMKAREYSYARYSDFRVGACLEAGSGALYGGCNIENASYSVTNCAERTAFFKAISEGETTFKRIAIVGGYPNQKLDDCMPCGVCLQVMEEFCDPDQFEVIVAKSEKDYKVYLLKDLLPMAFGSKNLIDNCETFL